MAAGIIADQWRRDDSERVELLDQARLSASLTKPWILPPQNQQRNQRLPESFQSVGPRGITNLEGKMLLALWPPNMPWMQFRLASQYQYNPGIPPEEKQSYANSLYMLELTIQSILESSTLDPSNGRRRSGFRSQKRQALSHILITGEVLEELTDDYRIKIFRRDQYVTKRDSTGDVLYHIIREELDPLILSDEQLVKANLSRSDLSAKPVGERMVDIYTMAEYQPQIQMWLFSQEVNGSLIGQPSEEPVNRYMCTPFELVSGENYGRGFVEMNLGDLRSLDQLREKLLDFAAAASNFLFFLDESSLLREEDLTAKTGSVLRGRVSAGSVQDAAVLTLNKLNDFSVVARVHSEVRKDLGKAMLLEEEITPRGDRVTATQVNRIASELEGALGGIYSAVSDDQQRPLLDRMLWQMGKDNLIDSATKEVLDRKLVDVVIMTGVAALQREIRSNQIVTFNQLLQQVPAAAQRIDPTVWSDVMARSMGIDEPGLVKSEEQMQAEQAAIVQQQTAIAAGQQAAEVGGDVARAALLPQEAA